MNHTKIRTSDDSRRYCCRSVRSSIICCLTREAMRFRDALTLLFPWLPMRCPFIVLAFVHFTIGAAAAGNCVGGGTYLWAAGTDWLSLSATGCWLFCVIAVLASGGGSATSMMAGIGVFHLVCRWWMRGVVWRTLGIRWSDEWCHAGVEPLRCGRIDPLWWRIFQPWSSCIVYPLLWIVREDGL